MVHLYLAKVNLMLKSPLLPRFGDLVVAIVDDVLGQGLTGFDPIGPDTFSRLGL